MSFKKLVVEFSDYFNELNFVGIVSPFKEGVFKELMKDDFFLLCTRLHGRIKAQKFKSMAEHAWMNVEKRLRNVTASVLMNDDRFSDFINASESIILYFQYHQTPPPIENIPSAFSCCLRSSLSLNEGRQLFVPLIDSSFHRLLFHAACQYHGLKSKSIDACGKHRSKLRREKVKDVEVTLAKSNKLFCHGISMQSLVRSFHSRDEEVPVPEIEEYVLL